MSLSANQDLPVPRNYDRAVPDDEGWEECRMLLELHGYTVMRALRDGEMPPGQRLEVECLPGMLKVSMQALCNMMVKQEVSPRVVLLCYKDVDHPSAHIIRVAEYDERMD